MYYKQFSEYNLKTKNKYDIQNSFCTVVSFILEFIYYFKVFFILFIAQASKIAK